MAAGCGEEFNVHGTDDDDAYDTDGDDVNDGLEVYYGSDPLVPDYAPALFDTDADGFGDGDEVFSYGSDPLVYLGFGRAPAAAVGTTTTAMA